MLPLMPNARLGLVLCWHHLVQAHCLHITCNTACNLWPASRYFTLFVPPCFKDCAPRSPDTEWCNALDRLNCRVQDPCGSQDRTQDFTCQTFLEQREIEPQANAPASLRRQIQRQFRAWLATATSISMAKTPTTLMMMMAESGSFYQARASISMCSPATLGAISETERKSR